MEAKTRAVLSVLPAMIYSPVGLHARSYTCIVVHLCTVLVSKLKEKVAYMHTSTSSVASKIPCLRTAPQAEDHYHRCPGEDLSTGPI